MTEFLQSDSWRVFQEARGKQTHQASGTGWHFLAVHESTRFGLRIYTPGGPIADTAEHLEEALAALHDYAKSVGAYCIRVEPECTGGELDYKEFLHTHGYQPAHKNINPEHTIINDVTPTPDEIDAAISTRMRYAWRHNIREGVTFSQSSDPEDISIFLDMIHEVAERTGMQPHPDVYFRTLAKSLFPIGAAGLLVATYENGPVASLIYYTDGETMIYAHAASYTRMRKLSPATALLVELLHRAHQQGCTGVDLFGIAPDDAPEDHPWMGFTKFKRGFNGTPRERSGTWELPLMRVRYSAARLFVTLYDSAKQRKKH